MIPKNGGVFLVYFLRNNNLILGGNNMKFSFLDLYLFWAYKNLNNAKMYSMCSLKDRKDRGAVLEKSLSKINFDGLFLEFGVHKGFSINKIAEKLPQNIIYGFDSFEGFPEDGRNDWQQDFSTDIPQVRSNVELVVGYFDDTLDQFLSKKNNKEVAFAHIDCDIYSSTKTIFDCFIKFNSLKDGSILVFDELINYREYLWNELLALYRYLFSTKKSIEWLYVHHEVENIEYTLYHLRNGTYQNSILRGDGKYWRQQAACVIREKEFDYSELTHNEIFNKIKYCSREFQKIIIKYNVPWLNKEDFVEKYDLPQKKIANNAIICGGGSMLKVA